MSRLSVAMFTGGRGGASIARHLLRVPGIELTLLINGYDNGLSTGALRRYLPGMLGPSDFRKNLLLHLDDAAPLSDLLRYRFPAGSTRVTFDDVVERHLWAVPPAPRATIAADLAAFGHHLSVRPGGLDLADCALGNLVIAGAYLRRGADFNAAVGSCAASFGSPVQLLNVTNGENAYLAARKQNGRILADEADIVAPQDAAAVTDLFLLREPLGQARQAALTGQPAAVVRQTLAADAAVITLNPRVRAAVQDADLIVYGPGTPHSSLLPSYLTPGLAEVIATSRARAKVFVVNTRADHDVRRLGPADLVHRTLTYLNDPHNTAPTVTHVLAHGPARPDAYDWTGACWTTTDLEQPGRAGVHCGVPVVDYLTRLAAADTLVRP
jgi:2-phospho-L-lactate transferase/gluconeogenesis factor (CofD/UPF0052 family)